MSSLADGRCSRLELIALYALRVLPASQMRAMEAHIKECKVCLQKSESLRPVIDAFVYWPFDDLRLPDSLWGRLQERIGDDSARKPTTPEAFRWSEPTWEQPAPGIFCKLLATDTENDRVSMLVRLAPGVAYPPHSHAGVEELHLLEGELWIENRKLYPGDYNRAEAGTADQRVWSETGCTCVLITSARDSLR